MAKAWWVGEEQFPCASKSLRGNFNGRCSSAMDVCIIRCTFFLFPESNKVLQDVCRGWAERSAFLPGVFLFLIYKLCFSYLAASISSVYGTSWILPCRRVCGWGHFQVMKQTWSPTLASLRQIVSSFINIQVIVLHKCRSAHFSGAGKKKNPNTNPEETFSSTGSYRSEIWLNQYLKTNVCCTEQSPWPTTGLDADEGNYQEVNLSEWNNMP